MRRAARHSYRHLRQSSSHHDARTKRVMTCLIAIRLAMPSSAPRFEFEMAALERSYDFSSSRPIIRRRDKMRILGGVFDEARTASFIRRVTTSGARQIIGAILIFRFFPIADAGCAIDIYAGHGRITRRPRHISQPQKML